MSKSLSFLTSLAAVFMFANLTAAQTCQQQRGNHQQTVATAASHNDKDIVDTAVAAGNFQTLAAALQAAELVDTLKGEGPFTVFAPSDDAFKKLPQDTVSALLKPENRDKLTAILLYHVVPGRVMAEQAMELDSAPTAEGSELGISTRNGKVMINDATVVAADIGCSNGVIHVIDSVLLPPEKPGMSIVETAVDAGQFKTLAAALQAAELIDTLEGEGPFTVFAPTDEAFAALPAGTVEELLKPENRDKLTAVLTYHVVPGKVMAADVVKLDSAKTVQGSDVSVKTADGKVMIDNATVIKADIPCKNGVIHVIDSVILPKK